MSHLLLPTRKCFTKPLKQRKHLPLKIKASLVGTDSTYIFCPKHGDDKIAESFDPGEERHLAYHKVGLTPGPTLHGDTSILQI